MTKIWFLGMDWWKMHENNFGIVFFIGNIRTPDKEHSNVQQDVQSPSRNIQKFQPTFSKCSLYGFWWSFYSLFMFFVWQFSKIKICFPKLVLRFLKYKKDYLIKIKYLIEDNHLVSLCLHILKISRLFLKVWFDSNKGQRLM